MMIIHKKKSSKKHAKRNTVNKIIEKKNVYTYICISCCIARQKRVRAVERFILFPI